MRDTHEDRGRFACARWQRMKGTGPGIPHKALALAQILQITKRRLASPYHPPAQLECDERHLLVTSDCEHKRNTGGGDTIRGDTIK